jgi:dihydrofolate reductase
MRKIIFAINTSINGSVDHTVGIADDELHNFYTDLLNNVDVVLMGRKTYQLMESFWPVAHKDPGSTQSVRRFADKFNSIRKIVFSETLKDVKWQNSQLADRNLLEIISELKNQDGKSISAGSLSIARQLLKLNLIDEFWIAVHPIVAEKGPRLFEGIDVFKKLNFVDSITFSSGVVVHHYQNT